MRLEFGENRALFLSERRICVSAVVLEKGGAMRELVCRFCPNSHCPGEGHYKIQTTDGEFLQRNWIMNCQYFGKMGIV